MLRPAPLHALPFLLSLPLLGACGSQGSYQLHWSITCKTSQSTCPIETPKDCSDAGLDAISVQAVRGTDQVHSLFPCFGPLGPTGNGPGLGQGPIDLEVSALSPGGEVLVGPVSTTATIPPTGVISVDITLPRPPACNDGVDNDQDGLVDLADPECNNDPNGTSEGPP